jgi:hypothetical protein
MLLLELQVFPVLDLLRRVDLEEPQEIKALVPPLVDNTNGRTRQAKLLNLKMISMRSLATLAQLDKCLICWRKQ